LLWYEGAGLTDRRWLHADERGSVVAVSDGTGMVTTINRAVYPERSRRNEYGIPAPTNIGRFQYTGQAWISKIGMYYYKARMYSPTLGRFMQTDPIGYADGMNWYNYVGSDPVNNVDPSGLIFVSPTRFSNIGIPTSTTSFDLSVQDLVPGTIVTGSALYNPNPPVTTVDSSLFNSAQNQIINALTAANNMANGVGQGNGGPKAKPAPQSGKSDDCAFQNSFGQCVYKRDKEGKLQFTPEYQQQVCANFNSLQDGATKTNDGLTAVGVAAGTRSGLVGTIVGGLSTFGAFISSVTTGAGFRPFGFTIIPKSAPPPGC
jgi:RHS repeat-associated protein